MTKISVPTTHSHRSESLLALVLACIPAFCVVAIIFHHFWGTELMSDGATYWNCAQRVWDSPVGRANFKCVVHDYSYLGMGILGAVYKLGNGATDYLHMVMMSCYLISILAFCRLSSRLMPQASWVEIALVNLVFTATPALGVYSIALSLDLFVVMFSLLLVNSVLSRRILLTSVLAVALAFCKETGTVLYVAALPFILWFYVAPAPRSKKRWIAASALLLPLALQALNILTKENISSTMTAHGYCASSAAGFLFNTNLATPQIQNYLFDLFLFNFQWLLIVPLILACAHVRTFAVHLRRPQAEWVMVVGFLLASLYTMTRCPLWNNIKYVLMALPYPVLLSYGCLLVLWRTRAIRIAFFALIAILFGLSAQRSFDPVSMSFYGETPFGNGPMYCMQSRSRTPEQGDFCGRDEMIYSLQRLEFNRRK